MAEYVLASFLHFARGLHLSYRDKQRRLFDHRSYEPITIRDKTVCVVGAGGIGQEVGKLCAAAGMRVVGTRREVGSGTGAPEGFARLEPALVLHDLLRESEFVAICCPWTKETHHLIGEDALSAMKPGTVLVNIARGEIIDEEALIAALTAGILRGFATDVYDGEFERPPDSRLWDDERVVITPHVSVAADISEHQGVQLFCDNCTIDELYVAPAARGHGHASALIEALAAGTGPWPGRPAALTLEVTPDNRSAMALYERLGFRGHNRGMRRRS